MTIKIALLQSRSFPSKEESMAEHERLIAEAARNGANIICTQELCFTPYFCRTEDPDNFDLAETIPGPTTERFSALAAKYGVVLILSLFEFRAPFAHRLEVGPEFVEEREFRVAVAVAAGAVLRFHLLELLRRGGGLDRGDIDPGDEDLADLGVIESDGGLDQPALALLQDASVLDLVDHDLELVLGHGRLGCPGPPADGVGELGEAP